MSETPRSLLRSLKLIEAVYDAGLFTILFRRKRVMAAAQAVLDECEDELRSARQRIRELESRRERGR